jgi:hypothetical protein
VPIVLLFYWSRYLAAHDWLGTTLHLALILITAAFALRFYFTAKNALNEMARSPASGAGAASRVSASGLQLTRSKDMAIDRRSRRLDACLPTSPPPRYAGSRRRPAEAGRT